jgi:phage terminase large subunit-like protein
MAAHKKNLQRLVLDRSFLARRHEELLQTSPLVADPRLRELQKRFRRRRDQGERRAVALEFQRAVRERASAPSSELDVLLRELGPPGSVEQLLRFFPRCLRHYAGPTAGKPFRLESFQRRFLSEFFARERGERVYPVGLLGIPKGNGKTPLAAGLGLHALISARDAPEVYGVAGSREQAAIAHRFANRWSEEGPLAEWLRPGATIVCPERRGFYKLLSADGRLGQGVQPSVGIVDEWWLFEHPREREAYAALAAALHKRPGESWLLAITTAGWSKQTQLGETFDAAITHPAFELHEDGYLHVLCDREAGFLMHWYAAPEDADIEDPETIRRANPASWVRPRDLLRELRRPDTDELVWRRLHLNQWTRARDMWLPSGAWAKLRDPEAAIPAGAEVFAGVDVGWSHDSTAVALAHRRSDGQIVLQAKVWTTDPSAQGQYVAGGVMRLELIEEHIRDLRRRYQLREVAYDPKFFGRSAEILGDEGILCVEMLPSAAPMQHAWQSFYQAVVEGTIVHLGERVLTAHVDAAAADKTEYGWRVRKLRSSARIDALAAAVMAHGRAQLARPEQYLFTRGS